MMTAWDNVMTNVKLTKGADLEELLEELESSDEFGFDEDEKVTLQRMRIGKQVAPPRQLGDWITITIDYSTKSVSCNCERYNTYCLFGVN